MISLLCCAMHCFAQLHFCMPCFAMLCLAQLAMPLQCYDLLCYAWLCFAMLCFCMTSPCFAVLCFVQLCSALLCLAMLGSALLCLAKVMLRLRMLCWCCSRHCKNSGTHESGLVRHYKNNGFLEPDCCIPAVCSRKIRFFRSQSQIPRQNARLRSPCGGDHSRAQKMKNYIKKMTETHNEQSRDYFWGNLLELIYFRTFLSK